MGGGGAGRKVRVERTIRLRIPALYGPLMVHPRSAAQEYRVKWVQNITIEIQNLKCLVLLEYELQIQINMYIMFSNQCLYFSMFTE